MWAVRRASTKLRNQGLSSKTGQTFCRKTELAKFSSEIYNAAIIEPQKTIYDGLLSCTRFYSKSSCFSESNRDVRTFSSQTDAKFNREGLENGFSELEDPQDTAEVAVSGDENDDDLSSESELSEEEAVADFGEKKVSAARASSAITKAILASIALPVSNVMDKWVEEGNEVTQEEVARTMHNLRKRRLFVKAFQFSEWLESTKRLELTGANYVARVDLIAKVQGLYKAEKYMEQIPESFRNEVIYRTLLANAVTATNVKKAEELFNKIKDLGFSITAFACNQLLLLYKRTDKKKIADVLLLMEKENVKPTDFTYSLLIDVKGQSNDIIGMEQIVETMKAEGLKPSSRIQALLARYYAAAGLKDKAESLLKVLEGDGLESNRWVCRLLIPVYALLGRADEVERIWKVCESDPRLNECMAAIDAWGQLNKIENAEAAFERLLKMVKKPSSMHYTALLKVYTNHKMLSKGKDLANQMIASGCSLEPLAWNAIVKLYAGAGEVEKADAILRKAAKKMKGRPLFSSFTAIMDKYAERGDVQNAEKVFEMMREAGYSSRHGEYQSLLRAYVNAKTPAYGFKDRMKADNIFPSASLASLLAKVDAFKKSPVDDLLE